MPNISRKFYWLFYMVWLGVCQPILAQSSNQHMAVADTLFARHRYTQAFSIYERLLEKDQVYSPQMLLKMAYIQEGLKQHTQSMYYLQLYYSKQPSRSVLRKMEEVGLQQHLSGYEYTDWDFFKTQFYKYYPQILEIMLLGAAASLTIIGISWHKKRRLSKTAQAGFLFYLAFLFYFANFLTLGQQGIIKNANVPIMTAPAAGADLVASVRTGHKVNVLGEQDIWYRIEWKDQVAYIRKNNLLLLPHPLGDKELF